MKPVTDGKVTPGTENPTEGQTPGTENPTGGQAETPAQGATHAEVLDTVDANSKALATMETTAVAVAAANPITIMLKAAKEEFLQVNEGMDLDYVRVGDWLKINAKGNFVESADEAVSYGDVLDIVVGQGEKRFMLWGKDGSPEKGELIVAEKDLDDAKAALAVFLAEKPEAAERYTEDDIQLRYLAYVVPVQTLNAEDVPRIYLLDYSPTDTIGWGKFAMAVFNGKYKANGVPAKTAVNRIVIRLITEERKGDGTNWIGIKFDAVGMFDAAAYGLEA